MQQLFCVTTFWTWDSRHGGKLVVVRLWLSMLCMTGVAAKTNGVTVILFGCHCCLLSNANSWYMLCFSIIVACRLWVNRFAMPMNAVPYLFCQLILCLASWKVQSYSLISHNSSRVCERHFQRQPVADIYDVENMVHCEGEAVLLTAEGKIWWPVSVYK